MKISFVELENYYPIKIAKWLENAFRRFESVNRRENSAKRGNASTKFRFLASQSRRRRVWNQGEALYGIATKSRMESSRSDVWNQSEGRYTLRRDAIRLRRFHTRLRRDYIPILRIG